eukprot:1281066-Rhodomonas_salina.1
MPCAALGEVTELAFCGCENASVRGGSSESSSGTRTTRREGMGGQRVPIWTSEGTDLDGGLRRDPPWMSSLLERRAFGASRCALPRYRSAAHVISTAAVTFGPLPPAFRPPVVLSPLSSLLPPPSSLFPPLFLPPLAFSVPPPSFLPPFSLLPPPSLLPRPRLAAAGWS